MSLQQHNKNRSFENKLFVLFLGPKFLKYIQYKKFNTLNVLKVITIKLLYFKHKL